MNPFSKWANAAQSNTILDLQVQSNFLFSVSLKAEFLAESATDPDQHKCTLDLHMNKQNDLHFYDL